MQTRSFKSVELAWEPACRSIAGFSPARLCRLSNQNNYASPKEMQGKNTRSAMRILRWMFNSNIDVLFDLLP